MLIYKESLLNSTGIKVLRLPFESVEEAKSNILYIGLQYGRVHMWYNTLEKPKKEFLVVSIGTGHEYEEFELSDYIGTAVLYDGDLVLHY